MKEAVGIAAASCSEGRKLGEERFLYKSKDPRSDRVHVRGAIITVLHCYFSSDAGNHNAASHGTEGGSGCE